jgi:hypothetical protein
MSVSAVITAQRTDEHLSGVVLFPSVGAFICVFRHGTETIEVERSIDSDIIGEFIISSRITICLLFLINNLAKAVLVNCSSSSAVGRAGWVGWSTISRWTRVRAGSSVARWLVGVSGLVATVTTGVVIRTSDLFNTAIPLAKWIAHWRLALVVLLAVRWWNNPYSIHADGDGLDSGVAGLASKRAKHLLAGHVFPSISVH